MSESELILVIIMVGIGIGMLITIPAMYAGISAGKVSTRIYGDDEYGPILEDRNAKIIARRMTPHPLNQALMVNRVVFELANGSRIELAIKDSDVYGVMVEGDCGTLIYQGKRFIAFDRGSSNET